MDRIVAIFNAGVLLGLCALALWVAIDERFKTRILVTGGLGLTCIGSGTIGLWMLVGVDAWDLGAFNRAIAVLNLGVIVTVAGYVWRTLHVGRRVPKRRRTDWAALDDVDQHHVAGGRK